MLSCSYGVMFIEKNNMKKILVVYYSRTETTKKVAVKLAEKLKAEILRKLKTQWIEKELRDI